MSIEEKAKAYDEALEKVRPLYERAKKDDSSIWATYEHLFPQLAESEDERIRKSLVDWLKSLLEDYYEDGDVAALEMANHVECWIAYLERQKEQKPAEWSEEFLRLMGITVSQDGNQVCVLLGENLAEGIAGFGDTLVDAVEEFKKEWRQFDRFRKATWKPSEEQMRYLLAVINDPNNIGAESCYMTIKSLYNDLKKL